MKNLFLIFILFTFSCKSQTISLEDAAKCTTNPNCSSYTYAKDVNNSLDKYLGNWTGNYNGKKYEFNLIKQINYGIENDFRWDRLVGRLNITDSNGSVIYNTINEVDDNKTRFKGDDFQPDLKAYMMNFTGHSPKGCINYGTVYLTINPNTPNIMTIIYLSDHDIVEGDCPASFVQTFPEKKNITLTKQ